MSVKYKLLDSRTTSIRDTVRDVLESVREHLKMGFELEYKYKGNLFDVPGKYWGDDEIHIDGSNVYELPTVPATNMDLLEMALVITSEMDYDYETMTEGRRNCDSDDYYLDEDCYDECIEDGYDDETCYDECLSCGVLSGNASTHTHVSINGLPRIVKARFNLALLSSVKRYLGSYSAGRMLFLLRQFRNKSPATIVYGFMSFNTMHWHSFLASSQFEDYTITWTSGRRGFAKYGLSLSKFTSHHYHDDYYTIELRICESSPFNCYSMVVNQILWGLFGMYPDKWTRLDPYRNTRYEKRVNVILDRSRRIRKLLEWIYDRDEVEARLYYLLPNVYEYWVMSRGSKIHYPDDLRDFLRFFSSETGIQVSRVLSLDLP